MDEYNDYELVYLAQERNEEAFNILYKKYHSVILKLCSKYFSFVKSSMEFSDLYQECFMSFYDSILNFNESKSSSFYHFSLFCMESHLISVVRMVQREKRQILDQSISLDSSLSDDEGTLFDVLGDYRKNPESIFFDSYHERAFYEMLTKNLSYFEESVIILRVHDFNYCEIASILDKDIKSIDNAIQRIRNKIGYFYL